MSAQRSGIAGSWRQIEALPLTWTLAALAIASAVVGGFYALSAYAAEPELLPIVIAAGVAVTVGLARLEYGIALLILLTPFSENAPISHPSDAELRLALVLWAFALVAIQAGRVLYSEHRLQAPPMIRASALFLLAAFVSVLAANDDSSALAKFLLLSGSVALYVLIAMFCADWSKLKVVLASLLVAGLVISVHSIYQYAVGDTSTFGGFIGPGGVVEHRITSFFPHPNQLAGFLAVMVPISIGMARIFETGWARAACYALTALALVGVILTFSRGALIGLAALPLLYLGNRRAWPLIAGIGVAIVVLAPGLWHDRIAGATKTGSPEIASRIDFWRASIDLFQAHPITGLGLDNFSDGYDSLKTPGRTFLENPSFGGSQTAHSLYLNTLAEEGLVGITALLVLAASFVAVTLRLRRSRDPRIRSMGTALLGALIVIAFHNVFDVTFLDAKNSTIIWALFGIAAALALVDRDQVGPSRPSASLSA